MFYFYFANTQAGRTNLFEDVARRISGQAHRNVAIAKGPIDLNAFEKNLQGVIASTPSELFVFPVFLIDEDSIIEVADFINGIPGLKSKFISPPLKIIPLLFVTVELLVSEKKNMGSWLEQNMVDTAFLISNSCMNGACLKECEWSFLLEMFIEVIAAYSSADGQIHSFRHYLSMPQGLATFSAAVLEMPIRNQAHEAILGKYAEFAENQAAKSGLSFALDISGTVDAITRSIIKPELIPSPQFYNRYEKLTDIDAYPDLIPSPQSNEQEACCAAFQKTLNDTAQKDIRVLCADIFEKIKKTIFEIQPDVLSKTAEQGNDAEVVTIKSGICSFLANGGTIRSLIDTIADNIAQIERETGFLQCGLVPLLTYEEAEKNFGIDKIIANHANKLSDFSKKLSKWWELKQKTITLRDIRTWLNPLKYFTWYLKYFLLLFLPLFTLLCAGAYSVGLPLEENTFYAAGALSCIAAVSIFVFFVKRVLGKLKGEATDSLKNVRKNFTDEGERIIKLISEPFLAYLKTHTASKLLYFYQNILKAVRSKCDFFERVYLKKEDFIPSTIAESRLIAYKKKTAAPSNHEIEEKIPEIQPAIYAGFLEIFSPQEVKNNISGIFNKLEFEMLEDLRKTYPLKTISDEEAASLMAMARQSIPLALPSGIHANLNSFTLSVSSPSVTVKTADVSLGWDRAEAVLIARFYSGLTLNDI